MFEGSERTERGNCAQFRGAKGGYTYVTKIKPKKLQTVTTKKSNEQVQIGAPN